MVRQNGAQLVDRDPDRAAAAHLLRRTAMSVHQDRVDELAALSWEEAVADVLRNPGTSSASPPRNVDWQEVGLWWVDRMVEPDTGLLERMAWFWHGLLTTNAWKVDEDTLISDQLEHIRNNALGNFRTLLSGFVTSGALLEYLDASGSVASNPNENLARELMELFTLGRGNYSQDDVRSAARALSGWVVEDGKVDFDRANSFVAPLVFLGEQADWDTAMIVDRLCDHPATARRISSRLWNHLVGVPLSEDAAATLGAFWQDNDLEIVPLLQRILNDPQFRAQRLNKPRAGLEWFCAARATLGFDQEDYWSLESVGQMPYLPPNVSGWPDDNRWLSPGSLLARSSLIHNVDMESHVGTSAHTSEILDRCGIQAVSDSTVAALDDVYDIPDLSPIGAHLARWRLALTCPEFNLS